MPAADQPCRFHVMHGAILKAQNKTQQAIDVLAKVMEKEKALSKNAKATQNGVLSFCNIELASAYLAAKEHDRAAAALKKATDLSGYELYKAVQVKIHALKHVLSKAGK